MKQEAILHRVDSEYAYALDEHTLVLRLRISKNDNFKKIECLFNPAMRLITSQQSKEMTLLCEDEFFAYYEIEIKNDFPSFSYVFHLIDNDSKEYFYSDQGISDTYDFALSQVSAFRFAFINPEDITRANKKFEGRIIYQIFVDSFCSSDLNKPYITRSWDSTDLRGTFKDGKYYPVFLGGDLKGVISKLNYLKDLGVGAIYLTPIFKANTNHKYDTMDYFKVDEMFGGEDALKKLVEEAHKKDILICLDLVFNHTSYFHPFFQDVIEKGKESPYYDFYMIYGDKPCKNPLNYATFSEGWGMPKLNGNNDKVKEYCFSVAKHYLTKFNVDGFRLDVSNELPHTFWNYFSSNLRKIKPDIFLIGECWYNASSFLNTNEWDSTMNYPFAFLLNDFFAKKILTSEELVDKLNTLLMRYKGTTNLNLVNLIDSHDVPRLYESLKPNKDLLLLAVLLLVSYVGLPMIYYGDEIFMEGKQDPFNRKGMERESKKFNSNEHKLFKNILDLRKNGAFRSGKIDIKVKNELIVIKRWDLATSFTIIINPTNSPENIDLFGIKNIVLSNGFEDDKLLKHGFIVFSK